MKTSLAVGAFKSIVSRIHPQLPLSPKESQRLLNALTSSFNNQLDRHFPPAAAVTSSTASSAVVVDPPHLHHRETRAVCSSSTATADAHLASILTNPLFGRPAPALTPSSAAISQLKTKSKHPIQIFEDSVARGQATIEIGTLCLNAFRTSLNGLSEPDRESHILDISAGTRVLRWLWSSGRINTCAFAEDRKFVYALAYFLVAEANDSALWNLIETDFRQTSPEDSHPPAREMRRRKGLILCAMVKVHLSSTPLSDAPITAALSAFLRASDLNQSSPASTLPILSIATAGALLSNKLVHTDMASLSRPISAALYDQFIESCPLWDKNPSDRALYRVAGLKLHHPTNPSARDALYFIRHLKQAPAHPFLSPSTEAQRSDVFNFFFETVAILQSQGLRDDAAWVMEFMRQSFPEHFSEKESVSRLTAALTSDAPQTPSEPLLPSWRIPDPA